MPDGEPRLKGPRESKVGQCIMSPGGHTAHAWGGPTGSSGQGADRTEQQDPGHMPLLGPMGGASGVPRLKQDWLICTKKSQVLVSSTGVFTFSRGPHKGKELGSRWGCFQQGCRGGHVRNVETWGPAGCYWGTHVREEPVSARGPCGLLSHTQRMSRKPCWGVI